MSWASYRQGLRERLVKLAERLRDGSWQPGPLRYVVIPTYTGKPMPSVIPTVADRVVHRAMRMAVEPVLEASAFAEWVSGYRPRRNRLTALRQAAAYLDAGFRWVADVDVASVSTGSHAGEVTDWLAAHVRDGSFLARFRTALAGLPEPIVSGTGLAPLLINLRLSRVDAHLGQLRVVRFADNYCAFAPTRAEAEAAFDAITAALATVGLEPNAEKAASGPARARRTCSSSPGEQRKNRSDEDSEGEFSADTAHGAVGADPRRGVRVR